MLLFYKFVFGLFYSDYFCCFVAVAPAGRMPLGSGCRHWE